MKAQDFKQNQNVKYTPTWGDSKVGKVAYTHEDIIFVIFDGETRESPVYYRNLEVLSEKII